jgi:3-methyladenine DNA glycosylase AlkD
MADANDRSQTRPGGDTSADRTASATAPLGAALESRADARTREHWERYLKGAAAFLGVPMAGIRRAVEEVWREQGLDGWPLEDLLALARAWFARPWSEEKLAAVLLIAERLAPRLELVHAAMLREPLADGDISDWNVCDWYAVKALHGFLVARPEEIEGRSRALTAWTRDGGLWERRAALVAFVGLAARPEEPFPGFTELVLEACAANLVSEERFAQTGPGWVLRELSRHRPDEVRAFVDAHPELSREGRRMATARLRSGPYRRR